MPEEKTEEVIRKALALVQKWQEAKNAQVMGFLTGDDDDIEIDVKCELDALEQSVLEYLS